MKDISSKGVSIGTTEVTVKIKETKMEENYSL